MRVNSFRDFADFRPSFRCASMLILRRLLQPTAAALALSVRAKPPHRPTDDDPWVAALDQPHTPQLRPRPRGRFAPYSSLGSPLSTRPKSRRRVHLARIPSGRAKLSKCIGRGWGVGSGADDEHEPCLPSGGRESVGRGSGIARSEWSGSPVGP